MAFLFGSSSSFCSCFRFSFSLISLCALFSASTCLYFSLQSTNAFYVSTSTCLFFFSLKNHKCNVVSHSYHVHYHPYLLYPTIASIVHTKQPDVGYQICIYFLISVVIDLNLSCDWLKLGPRVPELSRQLRITNLFVQHRPNIIIYGNHLRGQALTSFRIRQNLIEKNEFIFKTPVLSNLLSKLLWWRRHAYNFCHILFIYSLFRFGNYSNLYNNLFHIFVFHYESACNSYNNLFSPFLFKNARDLCDILLLLFVMLHCYYDIDRKLWNSIIQIFSFTFSPTVRNFFVSTITKKTLISEKWTK